MTAAVAKLKALSALGENPSEMFLDVGSTPTISTKESLESQRFKAFAFEKCNESVTFLVFQREFSTSILPNADAILSVSLCFSNRWV